MSVRTVADMSRYFCNIASFWTNPLVFGRSMYHNLVFYAQMTFSISDWKVIS